MSVAVLVAIPAAASAQVTGLRLTFSTSSDRSAPADLAGAVVSGDIYVFVTDETGDPYPAGAIGQVRFFTNGAGPTQVENNPPYDYQGGSSVNPKPVATTDETDGPFTISAEVDVDGSTTNLNAPFTIQAPCWWRFSPAPSPAAASTFR